MEQLLLYLTDVVVTCWLDGIKVVAQRTTARDGGPVEGWLFDDAALSLYEGPSIRTPVRRNVIRSIFRKTYKTDQTYFL